MADEEQNGAVSLPKGAAAVNKMIRENSDIFSDSHCKVCSAVLISESQKLAHYQSMKHANKVRRYLSIHKDEEPVMKKFKPPSPSNDSSNGEEDRMKACPVCNMTFSSPVVAQSHYQGKVHSKNLKLKEQGIPEKVYPQSKTVPKKPSPVSAPPEVSAGNDPEKFCSICHASFNNPLMSKQHYVGKKHKKQMTKVKLMEHFGPSSAPASTVKGYPCSVCNIELNSVEQYQAHISGAKHKNNVTGKKQAASFVRQAASFVRQAAAPPEERQFIPDFQPRQDEYRGYGGYNEQYP
ncbi:zinc finger protein 346-like [Acipenser oxyrinchus oxyrinchus]|uniref:Zinc finger protein 346 n=1 Tax=Acipenser oxyrinchus oxyrinchus TaxID=40147 RepID=A0AAD8D2M0_ACIOX|nr:zinc finger protein 346-like [Acipenser oxyrinchus oxyrinchus]